MMSTVNEQLQQGVKAHMNGNLRAAESAYQAVLALDSENATAHNNLGFIYGQEERWDEAMLHLRTALEKNPASSMAHSNLGQVLAACGQWNDGLAHLEKAVAIDPENGQAWDNLGRICLLAGNAQRAEYAWQRALGLNPGHADLLVRLGTALAAQRRYAEALACYQRAIRIDSRHANAWAQAGITHLLRNDLGSAREALHYAHELRPQDTGVMRHLALLCMTDGETEQGIAWYENILALGGEDSETRIQLAIAFLSRQQPNEALAQLDALTDIERRGEKAQYYRGVTLRELGRTEEADACLRRVISSAGKYAGRAKELVDSDS